MLNRTLFIYLFAHLAPAAIGLFAVALYTHLMSPADYGQYVIGTSIAGIVASMFFSWIRLSVSRYQATSAKIDLRGAAIVAYCAAAAVLAAMAPVAIVITRPGANLPIIVTAVFIALTLGAFEIGQELRRARLEPRRFMVVAVLRSALGVVFGYAAIKLGGGGLGLLIAVAASYFCSSLFKTGVGGGAPMRLVQREHIGQFVRYGLPLSIGGLLFALYSTGDRLIVAYLLGQEAAGQYGLSADLSRQFIVILAASCASATVPVVFRTLANEGAARARAQLSDSAELMLAIIAPVAIWLVVASDVFASVMLGPQFRAGASLIMPLLVAARMMGAFNQFYLQTSFQLAEKPLPQVLAESLILVVSVVLLVPLAYAFGVLGAAIATVLTEATGLLIGWRLSKRAFAMPFDGARIARVFAASAALAAAVWGAKLLVGNSGLSALIVVFLAGALAYGAMAYALNIARVRTLLTGRLLPLVPGLWRRAVFRG